MIIGIDAGGTNVDAVLLTEDGIRDDVKSSRSDPVEAIEDVLGRLLEDRNADSVERVVVATTRVLNAAVEDRLPSCSNLLIPGPGLRPQLAFHGDSNRVLEGCVDHRGRVTEEVNVDVTPEHEVVAITSKFDTRNPDLERTVFREIDAPESRVALGHETSGRLGFPNRAATTVFNAKGKQELRSFSSELEDTVSKKGVDAPVFFLKGDAGMLTESILSKTASHTVRAGPAASALGLLSLTGETNAVCVDIGGTTTDITLIEDGYPALKNGFETNGLYSLYRAVHSIDLPVGGDTRIDENGLTGRRRGDASAFGGPEPTPTDALHVCNGFSDGNADRAREAMETLGDPEAESRKVIDEMLSEISGAVERLVDRTGTRPDQLVAGGVLAPYLVDQIADRCDGIQSARAPEYAHVAGAVGCAAARVSLQTHVHIDSAQGLMTVNRPGKEEKRHVTKGKTFDDEELVELGKEEAIASARLAGETAEREAEVQNSRSFNVVQQGRRQGQIANMTAQVVPGLDYWMDDS